MAWAALTATNPAMRNGSAAASWSTCWARKLRTVEVTEIPLERVEPTAVAAVPSKGIRVVIECPIEANVAPSWAAPPVPPPDMPAKKLRTAAAARVSIGPKSPA